MLEAKGCPSWLVDWYTFLMDLFHMGSWVITVDMVDDISGTLNGAGRCTHNAPYLYAYIELKKAAVKDEPYNISLHEFLHVLTSGTFPTVNILLNMVGRDKDRWLDAWDAAHEPDIERLARVLAPILRAEMERRKGPQDAQSS